MTWTEYSWGMAVRWTIRCLSLFAVIAVPWLLYHGYLAIGLLLGAGFCLGLYARWIEPRWFQTTHVIWSNKSVHKRVKIVFISDIHVGVYISNRRVKQIVRKIQKMSPDMVLYGGDFVYGCRSVADLRAHLAPLQSIKCPQYGVLGNHDLPPCGEVSLAQLTQELEAVGVTMIDDSVVQHAGVTLVGLGDSHTTPYDPSVYTMAPATTPKLILTHNPDRTHDLPHDKQGLDLALCGHTHGGQVWLPWGQEQHIMRVAHMVHPFNEGTHSVKNRRVFVTRGIGEVGYPVRLAKRPEIVCITVAP